jgi:hypothetical protein
LRSVILSFGQRFTAAVRGTSGGRDGEEKKMAPWAPRLMSGSLGRRAATLRLSKCFAAAGPHFANVKPPVARAA